MSNIGFLFLWIICTFAIWYIYHKFFCVLYFDLFNGCMREIIISGFFGAILAVLIIRFWYIAVVVILLFLVSLSKR